MGNLCPQKMMAGYRLKKKKMGPKMPCYMFYLLINKDVQKRMLLNRIKNLHLKKVNPQFFRPTQLIQVGE